MDFNYPIGALEDPKAPFNENLEKDIIVEYYYVSKIKTKKINMVLDNNIDKNTLKDICLENIKDAEKDSDDIIITDLII